MKIFFLFLMGVAVMSCSRDEMRGNVTITFEVEAPGLEKNDVVYIVGDRPELGEWIPYRVPLMWKSGTGTWEARLSFPYGTRFEYKFTLGEWEREALSDDGSVPPNYTMAATRSHKAPHTINRWRAPVAAESRVTGELIHYAGIAGEGILPREVVVWLPPGYHESEERYPVLYMHDGQNVFDPAASYTGIDWGVDETADRLIRDGSLRPVIVVGIYNSPQREDDYGTGDTGAAYRRFVVEVVKPLVDGAYRTRPDREHTATMGSSMGGLVSFLLAWHYPDIFRQAACLSPAFFPESVAPVRAAAALPAGWRLYMDNGTVGLEEKLQVFCDDMKAALAAHGFTDSPDFAWFLDEGAEHNEAAWAARVERPLRFMFGLESSAP
jgi:predicted alpha/beta superfamily hydrolase